MEMMSNQKLHILFFFFFFIILEWLLNQCNRIIYGVTSENIGQCNCCFAFTLKLYLMTCTQILTNPCFVSFYPFCHVCFNTLSVYPVLINDITSPISVSFSFVLLLTCTHPSVIWAFFPFCCPAISQLCSSLWGSCSSFVWGRRTSQQVRSSSARFFMCQVIYQF